MSKATKPLWFCFLCIITNREIKAFQNLKTNFKMS